MLASPMGMVDGLFRLAGSRSGPSTTWLKTAMASLAWLFDCLDQQLFIVARGSAMSAPTPYGPPILWLLIVTAAAVLCSFTYVVAQIYGVGLITSRLTGVTFELGIFLGLGGVLVGERVAKVLIDAGSGVAVEAPTYLGALQAFSPMEPEPVSVASDSGGVIVDDMVDTAGTLCKAAAALKDNGARRVVAYCTHPVLSGPAIDNLNRSVLDELVVTDTIPLSEAAQNCSKIRQVSLSGMLTETLRRINNEESISAMFDLL